ncbi:DNA-processing protein DprA [Burkholderia sp. WAC0059]|uniref:DNA-processing protein DprA n=1 Tax=Burkholderia sp. WAC0059 TaxID=2066022 RepID=UPI00215568C5|nr:DNA-processing protein DprA [Burkholderia sp. WAC0059]
MACDKPRTVPEDGSMPVPAPLPLTDGELAAWLRLSTARGLKPAALRMLLAAFGLPAGVLGQTFAALAVAGGEAAARAVLAPPAPDFPQRLAALRVWLALPGNAVVTLADPTYPPRLLTMPDPPPLLYIRGRPDRLHARAIAVVGSRNATPQGLEDARRFARAFSDAGIAVVSGLALGVDGAAHLGALEGPGGTVAVIGTGADLVYPAAHHALAARIAGHGAIVSEWPLGTPARAAHFPQRNRLIAGLVEGVLVVEAAARSGSLITARLANEMGRDVFALPGSIHAPLARGCHRLLRQGALLVETPGDVLEELGIVVAEKPAPAVCNRRHSPPSAPGSAAAPTPAGTGEPIRPAATSPARIAPVALGPGAKRLLDAIGHAPVTLEILAQRTDMTEAALQGMLLQLELAGHLAVLPGGRFVRTVHP